MIVTDNLLQQGIAAAQAGNRPRARALLTQLVESDERNEQGWLWLAGVLDDPEEMRTCLENVLELNPANPRARQGLTWIETRYGPAKPSVAASPEPASSPVAASLAPAPAAQPEPTVAAAGAAATLVLPETATDRRDAKARAKAEAQARAKADAEATAAAKAQAKAEAEATAKARSAQRPLTTPDITDTETACPFCGALNTIDRTWCYECEQSLMIRSAARDGRSIWVAILGYLWLIGGVFGMIGIIGLLILTLGSYAMLRGTPGIGEATPFPYGPLAGIVFGGLITIGQIMAARALLDKQRWGYLVIGGLTLLNLAGAIIGAVLGAAFFGTMLTQLDPKQMPEGSAEALAALGGGIGIALLIGVGYNALFALLAGLCWRDFYGPKVRFVPEVHGSDDVECFNIGMACKRRKMWFMAMRQWEAAARKAPRDPDYLHALGLAYVQLKRFDEAHDTLDRAAKAAPGSEPIRQSLARLEQLRPSR
jgi:tetratricopeptide (TPR) repeat protein